MKWFKYLRRTPLAQIRADWAEYIDLWRKCSVLRGVRNVAYEKLVTNVNGNSLDKSAPSCIKQIYYYIPSLDGNDSSNMLSNKLYLRHSICKNFCENSDVVKCKKSDCVCAARNHEYVDACDRYNLMRKVRSDFWRVKFAQMLQKTK